MSRLYDATMRWLDRWPTLVLLGLLVLLPVYGPIMGPLEGAISPVTSRIKIIDPQTADDGHMRFRFNYEKIRFCEFIGVRLDIAGKTVGFQIDGDSPIYTRPIGGQVSRIIDAETATLDGAEMWFYHRCNSMWVTVTKVLG